MLREDGRHVRKNARLETLKPMFWHFHSFLKC